MCRLCRQKRRSFFYGQLSAGGTAASQHEGGDLLTKFRAPSVCVCVSFIGRLFYLSDKLEGTDGEAL